VRHTAVDTLWSDTDSVPPTPTPSKPALTPEERKRQLFASALVVVSAVGLVFLVPLLVAAPIAYLTRHRLKKIEAIAVAAFGVFYLAYFAPVWGESYFRWYGALVGMDTGVSLRMIPWEVIVAFTAFIVGAASLIKSNRILSWNIGKPRVTAGHDEQILPTPFERGELTRTVVMPGTSVYAAPTNSLTSSKEEIGKRDFPVGLNKSGEPVFINESEIRYHGLLFGSTGSGKTETIKVIAAGLLDLGWTGLILDLKEDAQTGGLMDWCQNYADYHALAFQKFRLSEADTHHWFNVLHGMGSDEARDTILASQDFEAAYYRALNELQLGQLITLLYAAHEIDPVRYGAPTVYGIGKILASPDLPAATREMVATVITSVPGFVKEDFNTLIRPDKAQTEAAGGLGARLTAMYETKVGRNTLRDGGTRTPFDVTQTGLSYIGLDSSGKPELTKLVSSSVLQRMAVLAADITNGKLPKRQHFLIVDEANFVSRKLLLELLSRARSAGIATIVCTQGPTDWAARTPGEPDLKSLVQNCNVSIIMSQGERTNAELCADIIGRAEKNVISQRVQEGQLMESGSLSTTIDYLVSPDALRSLSIGEAIIRVGKPGEWRSWIKVLQRDAKN
jgi:hypothetical protein